MLFSTSLIMQIDKDIRKKSKMFLFFSFLELFMIISQRSNLCSFPNKRQKSKKRHTFPLTFTFYIFTFTKITVARKK